MIAGNKYALPHPFGHYYVHFLQSTRQLELADATAERLKNLRVLPMGQNLRNTFGTLHVAHGKDLDGACLNGQDAQQSTATAHIQYNLRASFPIKKSGKIRSIEGRPYLVLE